MKIIESFVSIQGEGLRTGRPSLFIRLHGCNLRCIFHSPEGKVASICDTSYASFGEPAEKVLLNEDVVEMLENNPGVRDIVITGGEPLLFQKDVVGLISELKCVRDITVTIETNGTIVPCDELLEYVDLWSVSPKLASTTPTEKDCKKYQLPVSVCKHHDVTRINNIALATILNEGHDCQFKFVYTGPACIEEIDRISNNVQALSEGEDINNYIMLMPEGITPKAITGKSDDVVKICIERGWTYTSRMHILIWGNVKEK